MKRYIAILLALAISLTCHAAQSTMLGVFADAREGKVSESAVRAKGDSFRKVTDEAGVILALGALSADATERVRALVNHENMTLQGANGPIFALIALNSAGYPVPSRAKWTRDALIGEILKYQKQNGAFSLTVSAADNPDITAMAICALSWHLSEKRVKSAVSRATDYLSETQTKNGGFSLYGSENSESAAQVVIALKAIGKNPREFKKGGKSVYDALMKYRLSDGSFSHTLGGASDGIATEQARLAEYALAHGNVYNVKNVMFYDMDYVAEWAWGAVLSMKKSGMIKGSDGKFRPRDFVTRAELAAIICRVKSLRPGNSSFSDVAKSAWYASAVSSVTAAGYMAGSGGRFSPNARLTRQELAVVLARMQHLSDKSVAFSDTRSIAPWARGAVGAAASAGILAGSDGKFSPAGAVTREMLAVVISRIA